MSFDEVFAQRVSFQKHTEPYVPVTMVMAPAWPPMCTVRLWAYDVVFHTMPAPVSCDLEYILQKLHARWRLIKEHECIDYPCNHEHGYRDIYCHNKTMLKLFLE